MLLGRKALRISSMHLVHLLLVMLLHMVMLLLPLLLLLIGVLRTTQHLTLEFFQGLGRSHLLSLLLLTLLLQLSLLLLVKQELLLLKMLLRTRVVHHGGREVRRHLADGHDGGICRRLLHHGVRLSGRSTTHHHVGRGREGALRDLLLLKLQGNLVKLLWRLRGHVLRRDGVHDGGVVFQPESGLQLVRQGGHSAAVSSRGVTVAVALGQITRLRALVLQWLEESVIERPAELVAVGAKVEERVGGLDGLALLLGEGGQLLVGGLLPLTGRVAKGVIVKGVELLDGL